MDENVFVGVELVDADEGVNIIIEKAWATPIPSPYHSPINIPIVDHRYVTWYVLVILVLESVFTNRDRGCFKRKTLDPIEIILSQAEHVFITSITTLTIIPFLKNVPKLSKC